MSTPSGQPSPTLRIAGVALVAVALVLAGVGILADDGDSGGGTAADATSLPSVSAGTEPSSGDGATPTTDAPAPDASSPTASAAPGDGAPAAGDPAAPSSVPRSTVSPAPSAPAPAPAPGVAGSSGGTGATGSGGAGGAGSASTSGGVDFAVPVRVYNNSTITGLASDAARELEAAGWDEVTTGNYAAGIIPTTTVYYRPGTAERTAADRIASTIGARSEERFAGLDDATPGVIVIVTNDYSG